MKYTVFILRKDGVNTGYNPNFTFDNKEEFLEFIELCLKNGHALEIGLI